MTRLFTLVLGLFLSSFLSAQPISWLTDCTNKTFCFNQGTCTQGAVYMVEKAYTNCPNSTVNYSYRIDLNNDGTQEIISSEDTVSGNFNVGTHKIIWRAADGCGNVVQCTYLFTIKDCNPPNLICINGLTQTIDPPNCEASFQVNQFILNTNDNCTSTNQIERGIRVAGTGTGFPTTQTVTFGLCDNGINLLEVWVRDAGGLTNQCSNYVLIQSSDPACGCNPDGDLSFSGCVRTIDNQRISTYQPRVTVESTAGVTPPVTRLKVIATTDSCFNLAINELPFDGNYKAIIRADRDDSPLNGVTTFDLVMMSKHILAIESLTSAYQMEAADVNNSNSITTFDIVETRKLILGIYDSFPGVPSWRICKPLANPSLLSSYTALQDTYQLLLTNLQADLNFSGYGFVALKYGDLNGSVAAAQAPPDDRSAIHLLTEDRWLQAGEEVLVSFRLDESAVLNGWQLALQADPALLQVLGVEGLEAENYLLNGNDIRALWFDAASQVFQKGQQVLTLRIKAIQPARLSQALKLNMSGLPAEAYRPDGPERSALYLYFSPQISSSATFLGTAPNPFSTETGFNLEVKESASALLEIFQLNGQLVYTGAYDLEPGSQTIRVGATALPEEKMFVYRLRVGEEVFTGKLVRGF